jgi:hypothetical protein
MAAPSRQAPLALDAESFRTLGHALVDQLAGLLAAVPDGPVTRDEPASAVRAALDLEGPLPEQGTAPGPLLAETAERLFGHSLFNAHPRFFGYITASPAPIGILGDLLASALNANVGARTLSPAATEVEAQTIRWIAQLIGFEPSCGGLMVSGGNMANLVCFWAARAARAGWDVRQEGTGGAASPRLRVYGSAETHTWIQKAADLSGLGTASIRWIPVDADQRMDVDALRRAIEADVAAGDRPLLVVGTAGTVSTGAVDPLPAFYWSFHRFTYGPMRLVVKSQLPTEQIVAAVRREVRAVDPGAPIFQVWTLDQVRAESLSEERLLLGMLWAFAGVALLLAALGTYGVVAFAVQQRTREFGIRLAIGADARRVRALVLRQAAGLVVAGGVLGLGGALLAGRVVETLLFGVTPFDVTSYLAATATLALAVLGAAWWPARRASRVNPLIALTGRV